MLKIFGYASAIQLILPNALFSVLVQQNVAEGVEVEIDESKWFSTLAENWFFSW